MKEYFNTLIKQLKPIKEKLFNPKTAKIFRITYSVVWNLILIGIICFILAVSLGLGVGAGYFASLVKDEYPRSYEELKKISIIMKNRLNYILPMMSFSGIFGRILSGKK